MVERSLGLGLRGARTLVYLRQSTMAQVYRCLPLVTENSDLVTWLVLVRVSLLPRRGACAEILDDIEPSDRDRFQRSRDAYLSLTREQIENPDWSKKIRLAAVPLRYALG